MFSFFLPARRLNLFLILPNCFNKILFMKKKETELSTKATEGESKGF